MNQLSADIQDFFDGENFSQLNDQVDIGVAPSFPYLSELISKKKESSLLVGGQDCHQKDSGAFTGCVSAEMLKDLGAEFVILGHSERRHLYHESSDLISEKVQEAARHSLTVVLCVGETLEERQSGRTFSVLESQLSQSLVGASEEIVLAYEPVWAIGTGQTATSDQAQEVHQWIRDFLDGLKGPAFAERTRLLYGGSVKPDNASDLLTASDIDGLLVGGASLKQESFRAIIEASQNVRNLSQISQTED